MYISELTRSLSTRMGSAKGFPACLQDVTQAQLDDWAGGFLAELDGYAPDALRVTDKMPYNYLHLGLIELLFPQACIIHCTRDPMDTCVSCYFQYFLGRHDHTCDLAAVGGYYRQYQRLMAHWRETISLPMMEVSYEAMVEDQQGMTEKLLTFCGLEWDDNCLQFHKSGRAVSTASYDQVRQPIYRSSVQRWKHYEKHLGPLKAALQGS